MSKPVSKTPSPGWLNQHCDFLQVTRHLMEAMGLGDIEMARHQVIGAAGALLNSGYSRPEIVSMFDRYVDEAQWMDAAGDAAIKGSAKARAVMTCPICHTEIELLSDESDPPRVSVVIAVCACSHSSQWHPHEEDKAIAECIKRAEDSADDWTPAKADHEVCAERVSGT